MFDSLQSQLGKLLGKREDDPQQTITADQLKVVLKSIEGKYNNLKNENKLYKSKIEEQKNTIAELEKAVSELKAGAASGSTADAGLLTQLESDLDTVRTQLSENQELLANLRAEKLQLQSKLSVQEALVSSLRHEMSELREGHASAASPEDHAKALARVERLEGDKQELQAKIQDLSQRLVESEDAKEDLQPELRRMQEALNEAMQDVEDAKKLAEAALQGKRQAEAERDGVMTRLEPLVDELDQMRDQLEEMETERDALKMGTSALPVLQQELATVREQLAAAVEAQSALQMDKDELKHQTSRQQSELDSLQEQLAAGGPQAAVIEDLETKLMETRGQLDTARSENHVLQERLKEVMAEPAGMNAREKTELEFGIRRLSEELREAALQIASLREAKVKANLDLEEAAAELVELRRQLDDMRRDRNLYRDRLEERRAEGDEMEHVKAQMRELMSEMSRLRTGGVAPAPEQRPTEQPTARPEARPVEPERPRVEPAAEAPRPSSEIASGALARRREMLNKLIGERKQP